MIGTRSVTRFTTPLESCFLYFKSREVPRIQNDPPPSFYSFIYMSYDSHNSRLLPSPSLILGTVHSPLSNVKIHYVTPFRNIVTSVNSFMDFLYSFIRDGHILSYEIRFFYPLSFPWRTLHRRNKFFVVLPVTPLPTFPRPFRP